MKELKYKLISCDMDDTLIGRENTVSKRNLEAIREFERRGGVFMANTGRMHASAIQRVREMGLLKNSPVSSFQGAMIRESVTDKLLFYKPLGYELSLRAVTDAESMGIFTQVYDMGKLYFVNPPKDKFNYGVKYAERCGVGYVNVASLSGYIREKKMDCVKVLIMDEPERIQKHLEFFAEKYGYKVNLNTSAPFMGEIFSIEAGKDVACAVMCGKLGITIEECMAIGDSMNDYNMLKRAGLGVAVANARSEVLEIADYVVDSCEDDGVAKAIERFCL